VDYALKTLRNEYDRLIRNSDIPMFRRIQQERRIQGGDEEAGRLLHLRLVLEQQF
jgi:aspartate carbamoyltransferase catalytic subunit